ncbi:TPA: hypothetical protein ACJGQJ_002579 [Salmonella enterica subsp. enterica serovar Mgulani]
MNFESKLIFDRMGDASKFEALDYLIDQLTDHVKALEEEQGSAVDAFEDGFAAGEKRATEHFDSEISEEEIAAYQNGFIAGEQMALIKIEAAEYNAYEAGYRAASGGEPSPEHKAAISKPIKKEPAPAVEFKTYPAPIRVIGIGSSSEQDYVDLHLVSLTEAKKVWELIDRYNAGEIA